MVPELFCHSAHDSSDWLKNYVKFEEFTMIMIGDSTQLEGIGTGDIEMEAFNDEE